MGTLANEYRPSTFSEYIGQESCINYLTSAIKYNKHSNGLLITGTPGSGKSTAAFLYAKATLCENRLEGEYEPCNKCDSCLTPINNMTHPNITYYRITEASTFKEAVSDLITISKTSPVLTHSNIREDNYKRFIILDELQNASKQSISPFLDSLEFAAKDVTIILISMDLDSMDVIVKDAIESRCIELNLSSLSENLITNKLINTYPELSNKAAKLIAYLSNGNIRQAWSTLEFFNTQISIEEITSDYIAEQKLNNLTQANIELIIDSIQYTCWQDSLSLINKYISDSPSCVDYFIKYLLNKNLDLKGIELISSLSFWLQCNYKSPLAALFLPFQNTRLIKETENINTKSSSIKTIYSTEKILTNTAQDIQNQLTKIIGSSVSLNNNIPAFLQFKKWSQFITNYADNN